MREAHTSTLPVNSSFPETTDENFPHTRKINFQEEIGIEPDAEYVDRPKIFIATSVQKIKLQKPRK